MASRESAPVRGVQYVVAKNGWQVTHKGKYMGFFKKLDDANACKAAEMGTTVAQLQKRDAQRNDARGTNEKPRKYKNIIRISNGWQAHKWENGKLTYLGFATSDVEAAALVEKHTGLHQQTSFCPPPPCQQTPSPLATPLPGLRYACNSKGKAGYAISLGVYVSHQQARRHPSCHGQSGSRATSTCSASRY